MISVSELLADKTTTVEREFGFMQTLAQFICQKQWCPATFTKFYRCNENFAHADCLGLDVDGGWSLAQAQVSFASYRHIIATTKSHNAPKGDKPAEDRFRCLLFPATRITNRSEFEGTIQELHKQFPLVDKACKDPARFFYPCKEVISVSDGKLVDVVDLPPPPVRPDYTDFIPHAISMKTLLLLAEGSVAGENNNRMCRAAAGLISSQQMTEEEVFRLLGKTYPTQSDTEIWAAIAGAVRKFTKQ